MGKRGPKTLPIETHLGRGTHRRDRHGAPTEAVRPNPANNLAAPDSLGEVGKDRWSEIVPRLAEERVFTDMDRRALETYCRAHEEIARLDKLLEEQGEHFQMESGFIGQHPAVNQRFKWLEIKRRYETEFGMTASSRTGLVGNKPKSSGVATRKRTG